MTFKDFITEDLVDQGYSKLKPTWASGEAKKVGSLLKQTTDLWKSLKLKELKEAMESLNKAYDILVKNK